MVGRLFSFVAMLAAAIVLGLAVAPAALAADPGGYRKPEPEWCMRSIGTGHECRWDGTAWTADDSSVFSWVGFVVAGALMVGTVAGAAKVVAHHRARHDPAVVLARARSAAVEQAHAARRMRDAGSMTLEQYHRRLDQIIDSASTDTEAS